MTSVYKYLLSGIYNIIWLCKRNSFFFKGNSEILNIQALHLRHESEQERM